MQERSVRVFELISHPCWSVVEFGAAVCRLMAIGILSEPMHGYHIMVLVVVAAGIALA